MTEHVIPAELLDALMGEPQVEQVMIEEVSLSTDYSMGGFPTSTWVHFRGRYPGNHPRSMPNGRRVWLVWTHD